VIAGQVFWLDGADASTIRDGDGDYAHSGAGGANNGFSGSVATWMDKSGSGFNVTNGNAAQQPTYTIDGLNENNVVTFDGGTDRLVNSGAVIPGNDYTLFVVFNRTTAAGRDAVFELGGGGSRNGLFVNDSGNRLGFYANTTFYNSTNVYTPSTYELVTMIHDVNAISMWRGNALEVNTAGSARASTTGIYIGDDSTSGDQLQGNIAEFIVYDRDLTTDERRDIENYLASKWGLAVTNLMPIIVTNAGDTVLQGASTTITTAMLASSDADNSESILRYTITDLADHGLIINTNTTHTYLLGESFTQADIDAGYIQYTHDNLANFSDSFSFTVSDGYAATAGAFFNLTIIPNNQAPVFQGWTLVSSEDFEAGAAGWSNNTTTNGGEYLTRFLGRHSSDGGTQNVFKDYALSGTQGYTILTFDFYRLDSWDTEQFRIFIDDVLIFNQAFTTGFALIPDGSLGSVSWTVQEVTGTAPNFVFGQWNDQIMRFTMRIDNNTAGNMKLGFSSTLNQGIADESWGVDNINIYEVNNGGIPGPLHIVEGMANGTLLGTVTAYDPDVVDTLTYSITGGSGAGIFSIDASTGALTLSNTAAVDYETTTSYTLTIRVTDDGTGTLFDEESITINVIDRPENTAPTINPLGPLTVAENAAVNTVVGTVTGSDAEGDTITWSITGGNTDNVFAINATTGAIRIASTVNLNYEWDNSYTLTVQARDNGFANIASTRNIVINITDINEAPTFDIPQSFLNENPYLRYNPDTGNFYRYVATAVGNGAANAAASAALLNGVSGHLVTISNSDENIYVRGLGAGSLWLGGTDAAIEGEWIWNGSGPEGGQIFSIGAAAQPGFYTNWSGGQPDNGSNSDFLEMLGSGLWTDVNGGNRAYVIEWEGTDVLAALGNGPYTLAENPVMNQSVGFVHARDADAGDTIIYSVTGGTGAAHFAVNATTGEITVTNPAAINYESLTSFTLELRVEDVGGLFDTQTITIDITDVNEVPVIPVTGPFSVAENAGVNTVVGSVSATDPDAGQTITYSITGGNTGNVFSINTATGAIRIANTTYFDYELQSSYNLTIRATDNGAGALFTSRTITIHVTDVAEAPSFDAVQRVLNSDPTLHYSVATGNFYRYVSAGANLATAQANAAAALVNGVAGYVTNINSAAENTFVTSLILGGTWIGGSDATVEGEWRWIAGPEAGTMFWLGAAAGSSQNGLYANWSGGEPNNSGGNEDGIELRTNGSWNDTNVAGSRGYVIEWDGTAIVSNSLNGPYAIDENSATSSVVGTALANDPDTGSVLTYSITGGTGAGIFAINTTTGQITLAGSVNYEVTNTYTLDLHVQDAGGLFDTTSVTININDINDVPSLISLTDNYIVENSAIGTSIGSFSTTDEDPADMHIYSLVTNPGGKFVIVGNDLRTAGNIDYEANQSFTILVRTDDGNGGMYDQSFLIQVSDVMDTFTPSPTSGSAPGLDPLPQLEEEEFSATLDLLRSSLNGEQAQNHSFYNAEGWQVLRENITFQLREILALLGKRSTDLFVPPPANAPLDVVDSPQDGNLHSAPPYTNLRQAVEFLEQIKNAESQQERTDTASEERAKAFPHNTIDRQFVDVMTYHEQRVARLREALLSA
jgi:hypothetical protein